MRIRVLVTETEGAWVSDLTAELVSPGLYGILLPAEDQGAQVWVKAYLDVNNNGTRDEGELGNAYMLNPLTFSGPTLGVDIDLDPDSNSDGLQDVWEYKHFRPSG